MGRSAARLEPDGRAAHPSAKEFGHLQALVRSTVGLAHGRGRKSIHVLRGDHACVNEPGRRGSRAGRRAASWGGRRRGSRAASRGGSRAASRRGSCAASRGGCRAASRGVAAPPAAPEPSALLFPTLTIGEEPLVIAGEARNAGEAFRRVRRGAED